MKLYKKYSVKLDSKTYIFYNEIAKFSKKPIEDVLSDMLYKYVEIIVREASETDRYKNLK